MKKVSILIASFAIFLFVCKSNAKAQIVVVTHPGNSVNNLSFPQLKKFYTGKCTEFSDGVGVHLAEYTPLSKEFYQTVLHSTVKQFRQHWISLVFSGNSATPPRPFVRLEKLKQFIATTPGALSFIHLAEADSTVKILTIDGKKPLAPDYPLK